MKNIAIGISLVAGFTILTSLVWLYRGDYYVEHRQAPRFRPAVETRQMCDLKLFFEPITDADPDPDGKSGMYRWPHMIRKEFLRFPQFIADSAEKADFVILPVMHHLHRYLCDEKDEDCDENARQHTWDVLGNIDIKPWHIIMFSLDAGRCNKMDPKLRAHTAAAIHMQALGDDRQSRWDCFRRGRDVIVPPYTDPDVELHDAADEARERDVHLFFAGTVRGDGYSLGTREFVWKHFRHEPGFVILKHHMKRPDYVKMLHRAKFALHVPGNEYWSPRLTEAVVAGAVPVVVGDHSVLPFDGDALDWKQFSIRIPERDLDRLPDILTAIPPWQLKRMQQAAAEAAPLLQYHRRLPYALAYSLCRIREQTKTVQKINGR